MRALTVLQLCRAGVGVGEASYATISPTIIADMFPIERRTFILSLYYIAIPLGSALGFGLGSVIADALGSWRWAFRFTPAIGLAFAIAQYVYIIDMPRGASDGPVAPTEKASSGLASFLRDLRGLWATRSLVWSTAGFTCINFTVGALAQWTPTLISRLQEGSPGALSLRTIGLIFGAITCATGVFGRALCRAHRRRIAGPMVRLNCAACTDPLRRDSEWIATFPVVQQAQLGRGRIGVRVGHVRRDALCLACPCAIQRCPGRQLGVHLLRRMARVADLGARSVRRARHPPLPHRRRSPDYASLRSAYVACRAILLYVTLPERRSTAEGMQTLISHMLGDAFSPLLVGGVSDLLNAQRGLSKADSLRAALYMTAVVTVAGGIFFSITSRYVAADRAACSQSSYVAINDIGIASPHDKSSKDDIGSERQSLLH